MTQSREKGESGHVSFLPTHDGDGYSYGGGIIVTIGDLSINLGGFDAMKGYDKQRVALAYNLAATSDLLTLARLYASECAECSGHGFTYEAGEPFTQEASNRTRIDCEGCAHIREVIDKAVRS